MDVLYNILNGVYEQDRIVLKLFCKQFSIAKDKIRKIEHDTNQLIAVCWRLDINVELNQNVICK